MRLDGDGVLFKYRRCVQDVFGLCGVGPVKRWSHRHVKASAAPPSGRPEEEPDRPQTWCELLPLATTQCCISFLKQLQTPLCETILKIPGWHSESWDVSVWRRRLFAASTRSRRWTESLNTPLVKRVCLPPTFRGCRILSSANRKPLTSCGRACWLCVLLAGG